MAKSFRERLATMTPEELKAALQATAEGDRTHAAARLAGANEELYHRHGRCSDPANCPIAARKTREPKDK